MTLGPFAVPMRTVNPPAPTGTAAASSASDQVTVTVGPRDRCGRRRREHPVDLVRRVGERAVAQDHRLGLRHRHDGTAGWRLEPARLHREAVAVEIARVDGVFEAQHGADRAGGDVARVVRLPGIPPTSRPSVGRPVTVTASEKVTSISTVSPDLVGLPGAGESDVGNMRPLGGVVAYPEPWRSCWRDCPRVAHPAVRGGVVRVVAERHGLVVFGGGSRVMVTVRPLASADVGRAVLDAALRPRPAHHGEIDRPLARGRGRARRLEVSS